MRNDSINNALRTIILGSVVVWTVVGILPGNVSAIELPSDVQEFLEINCTGCHDSASKEGDLDLESLQLGLANPDNFHTWERVFDRVREGEMPPDESLDEAEASPFLESLQEILKGFDEARIQSDGRVPARRLTRAQYERNVSELLSVNLPLGDYLPEDSLTNRFDTVANSQQISDHSMAAYLESADAALDAAFAQVLTEAAPMRSRLGWKRLRRDENNTNRQSEGRPKHQDIVAWSTRQNFYGRLPSTTAPDSARYRIRLRVHAVNPPQDGRVWCSIKSGVCSAKASTFYWIGSFEATERPTEYEFEAWIRDGHMLQVKPNDSGLKTISPQQVSRPAGTVEPMGVPGVAIRWIEMERLDSDRNEARRKLIGNLAIRKIQRSDQNQEGVGEFEITSKNPKTDLSKLIQAFATRAFRRPVQRSDLERYIAFATERLEASQSMKVALRSAYRAILCSPQFLFFDEAPGILDDHALANRLSHFLWGRSPDDELSRLAAAGTLSEPATLRLQVERLLGDSRSETFINEFTEQWLQLHEINSTTPDGKLYPEYDDVLHHTLVQETNAFVRELIEKDLPVTNVVDSDFTFANSRLARHYDIEWPGGTGLKRVPLQPSSHRGGLITHASVLKVTANGTTTSPIIRGVWMLERIMGQHVPPPPANVSAVEPDIRGATSIRDQLDKHRDLESCASCHVKIDPPGFAMENYDVIGGWRERYRVASPTEKRKWSEGLPIDASHQFSDGTAFENIGGMKAILATEPERLASNLASQFITYSTGAKPTFADRQTIDEIVAATKAKHFGVRAILHEVIQSPIFLYK